MECIIRDLEHFNVLLAQVPCGRYESPKLFQHLRRGFPCISDPEPIVLLGLIAVILTSDDLPGETLEIIEAFTIWGVLHNIVCSKLLQHEVEEVVNVVKDPECHQRLHCLWVELREANV